MAKARKKSPKKAKPLSQTQRLLEVVHDLRTKCPWDKKQTHKTLIPYLLEEAYETVDAIHSGKSEPFREELGDLLLQVALHAELASERKGFGFEDVARTIADKMVRRHPHIYADAKFGSAKDHQKRWTELKAKEKPKRSLLEGIPRALPGLQLAQRYGEIAASVGFDWSDADQVLAKVKEELGELEEELKGGTKRAAELELGDLLFTLANLARHLELNAEVAMKKATEKFAARFKKLEDLKRREGKALADCTAEELDLQWNKIKGSEGHRGGANFSE